MNPSKNIIVVDDDPDILEAIRLILEKKGYFITILSSGMPIFNGEFELPLLFILDKQLPGVDGLEVCRHLKSMEVTKNIPVLILSASPQVAQLAKAARADDFLEKPFKANALREVVERLVAQANY